jgi:hypothetical protein
MKLLVSVPLGMDRAELSSSQQETLDTEDLGLDSGLARATKDMELARLYPHQQYPREVTTDLECYREDMGSDPGVTVMEVSVVVPIMAELHGDRYKLTP